MSVNYVPRRKVLKALGIHYHTFYNLVNENKIESIKIGKNSVYNLEKYIKENNISIKEKRKICYCRVSSQKQKEDLNRQVDMMKQLYPTYEIITDIASGINFKRKGLLEIINLGIKGLNCWTNYYYFLLIFIIYLNNIFIFKYFDIKIYKLIY